VEQLNVQFFITEQLGFQLKFKFNLQNMKNIILQNNNWNIFKLIDVGTSSERWDFLEQVVLENVSKLTLDGKPLTDEQYARLCLSKCLEIVHKKYPNIILGIEIKTVNTNQIVSFDYAKKQLI